MTKKKVAILGGGCGSMTAAYYLSNTPELRDALEVTVHQIGWRLGGKGASGRNNLLGERIQEHGLHVWGGFYYNAFRMMQECYGALGRPADCPLRNWDDAFKKRNFVAWDEQIGDRWALWPLHPPDDDEVPGSGSPTPSLLHSVARILGWIADAIEEWPHEEARRAATDTSGAQPHMQSLHAAAPQIAASGGTLDGSPLSVLRSAHTISKSMSESEGAHGVLQHHSLLASVRTFRKWLAEAHSNIQELDDFARRMFIVADLGLTMVVGVLFDAVPFRGYMAIDDLDFRNWLGKHGASKVALESATLRGYYDYFFAYEDGDPAKPRMSAGMGLHHMIRLLTDYKGSLFWKMQSGMGDAVFAPLYELCLRNGVKFEFFHRVDSLLPADDGKSIATVRVARQIRLKDGTYDPLVYPKNVPSWPSEPRYEQLLPDDVAALKRRNADLEDPWTDWDDVEMIDLKAGKDFDAVVLGLSIGAFPSVCKPILARDETWQTMVGKLPAIQTQAMQLWWTLPVDELGWVGGNATGTGAASPHQSWSDMSPVIAVENWPPANEPKSVVYFCGPMLTPPMPNGKDPSFGAAQTELARENAIAWSREYLGHLYPKLVRDGSLVWDLFFDPAEGSGEARFAAQYVRANYTPTERYVLDLPGTNRFRLEADTSGYSNLALAGDWIFTGLGGAVESAVMGGMMAARGLVRTITHEIVDETRSPWRRRVSLVPLR